MKRLARTFVIGLFLLTSTAAIARHGDYNNNQHRRGGQQDNRNRQGNRDSQNNNQGQYNPGQNQNSQASQDDKAIVALVVAKKGSNFVEGSNMVVTALLADDNQGLTHQKWMVRLSNGMQIMAVYNTDMCERVPLRVGDVVAMGGQFIWTQQGGLIHWLHRDPGQRRPDGYVELAGKFYCN